MAKYNGDCFIVQKERLYYQTECGYEGKTIKHTKFSNSLYDAKRFEKESEARRKAKQIGGTVYKFNPLTGSKEELPPKQYGKCGTCYWWAAYSGACCNGRSEHRGDFRLTEEGCDEWERKPDKGGDASD